jgi:hypothetical protein
MTTTIALTRTTSTKEDWSRRISTSLVASFTEFCAGARDGQEIHDRYRRYSRMSGPDLAEIGLSRTEIYRAALLGRPV